MAKNKKEVDGNSNFNQIKKSTNIVFNIIMIVLSALSLIPFLFVCIISLTDEKTLAVNGYKFFPEKLSLNAYNYMIKSGEDIISSYGITILITVIGTLLGLFLMGTYAYALSRRDFAYKKFFTWIITVPMLFGGGMVASYMINTQVLHLTNTMWALILPLAMSPYNIIVLRTFMKTSIPEAIIESAKIDGASEFRLFYKIIIPMAVPGLATIALFLCLGYWNDWFNAMLYMDEAKMIPLQYLLIKIENDMDFLLNNQALMGISGADVAASIPKDTIRMAIVVISTLPIACAYPFFQRYFVKGLTIGAVKE